MSSENFVGKTFLVGITDYNSNGSAVSQTQFCGTVEAVFQNGILLHLPDGSTYMLPPDLSSTSPAQPGSYRLSSTGEVIENPNYLSVWNRTKDANGEKDH